MLETKKGQVTLQSAKLPVHHPHYGKRLLQLIGRWNNWACRDFSEIFEERLRQTDALTDQPFEDIGQTAVFEGERRNHERDDDVPAANDV